MISVAWARVTAMAPNLARSGLSASTTPYSVQLTSGAPEAAIAPAKASVKTAWFKLHCNELPKGTIAEAVA